MHMVAGEPTLRGEIARGLEEHPASKGIRFNLLVTAVEIGGSISLFHLARHAGASNVASYLIGSIAPVLGGVMVWARARRFSGASASIFSFTALSALIALIGSTTPKVLLYKDCAVTGLIGLIFLGSCVLVRRPLVFYMAQRYGTDGTRAGMAIFDTIWEVSRDFRRSMYVTSYLWAGLFVVQAATTALIINRTSYSAAYNYDQILPIVAIGLGIAGSFAIGRHFNRKARVRHGLDHEP
jgi:hypothetical protein